MRVLPLFMVALAASAQGETILMPTYYIALHGADYATTEAGLARGAGEANPLMQERGARLAIKAVGTLALTGADLFFSSQQKKGRRGAKTAKWVVRVGAAVGTGFVVAHNIRTTRGARR